jgi:hypothetical protein
MPKPKFNSHNQLAERVNAYFTSVEDEYPVGENTIDTPEGKTKVSKCARQPEPPTIAGLALFLGFNSRQALEDYLIEGKFSSALKTGLLRIEAIFERKLHNPQSVSGAIFVLKTMGWNEKSPAQPADKTPKKLKIEVIAEGPKLADCEQHVVME